MLTSGEEYIDLRLIALMKKAKKDGGILLKDVPDPGESVVEVRTQHSLYKIAVINVEKREIAMQGGKHLPEPELSHLRGSTWGGSVIKVWLDRRWHAPRGELRQSRASLHFGREDHKGQEGQSPCGLHARARQGDGSTRDEPRGGRSGDPIVHGGVLPN